MTYHNFLEFIFTPISYFINWLKMVADSLMNNYFFITILGIVLFVSLFWLLFDTFRRFISRHISKYDDYNDKYNDYATYQKIQKEYYDRHRLDIYEFKYDKYAMSQQIIIDFFEHNQQLLFDYKLKNLKLNKLATYSYLTNNTDIESAIDMFNYRLKKQVSHDYLKSYHDDEIQARLDNKDLALETQAIYELKGDRKEQIKNIKKTIQDNSSIVPPEPVWFDKVIENQPLTPEEQEEMQHLLDNF